MNRNYPYLLLLLLILHFNAFSQDWQSNYDEAQNAYKLKEYALAKSKAEKALELAVGNEFNKPRAFTLQLITLIGMASEDFDYALQWIEKEEEAFGKLGEEGIVPLRAAFEKHIQLLQSTQSWDNVPLVYDKLLAFNLQHGGEKSYDYLATKVDYAQMLLATQQYGQAAQLFEESLSSLAQLEEGGEDYLYGQFGYAVTLMQLGKATMAEKVLTDFIDLVEANSLTDLEEYAEAKKNLAELKLNVGTSDKEDILANAEGLSSQKMAQEHLKIALEYVQKSDWPKARANFLLAVQEVEKGALSNATAFSVYYNFSNQLLKTGAAQESDTYYTQAETLANTIFKAPASEFGYLYTLKGDLRSAQNRNEEAASAYTLAFEQSDPKDAQVVYIICTHQMLFFTRLHAWNKAIAHLQTHREKFKHVLNADQTNSLKTFEAGFLLQVGNYGQAESLINEALSGINLASMNALQQELFLLSIESRFALSDYAGVLQAIDQAQQNPEPLFKAELMQWKGKSFQKLAKYAEAEKAYSESVKLFSIHSPGSSGLANAHNTFATFYITLGNYGAAEKLYNQLIKESHESSPLYTTFLENLASIYQLTLRYQEASELLEKAKVINEKELGAFHPDFAITLQNLGALYRKTDELEKAKQCYEQALAIDKRVFGTEHLSYANKLSNLGVVYQELDQLEEAERLLEEALAIRERKLGKLHPDYAFSVYNLAVLKQRRGKLTEAAPLFSTASTIYLKQIKEVFPSLSEQEKTAFYNRIKPAINAYQDFAIEYAAQNPSIIGELYTFRLATKALLLTSTAKLRQTILNSNNPGLIGKYQRWNTTKEELAKLYALSLDELKDKQNLVAQLEQEANSLEKELSLQSEAFSDQVVLKEPTWLDIRSQLKDGEAAIEMLRMKLNIKQDSIIYALMVITPQSLNPALVVLKDGKLLEGKEFKAYINSIKFRVNNDRSFNTYWKPLESELAQAHTVYLSADGIYNKINLSTLHNPSSGKFLLEEIRIRMLSNTKELLQQKKPKPLEKAATLVGFPNYKYSDTGNAIDYQAIAEAVAQESKDDFGLTRGGIAPLPGTKTEVENIGRYLTEENWQVSTLLQNEALEDNLKKLDNPPVLHIATHGFFIENQDTESDWVYSTEIKDSKNNPLLRSGLLLAGAEASIAETLQNRHHETTREDGVLTAFEAMNLRLDNTELVVLSACETGSGEVSNGEGVYGLQRSFMVAGAQNLLMSLWKVNDQATQALMSKFYKNWLINPDKHQALQAAQLELMKEYQEPYFWGAFILIGK